jgi:hypothetical protein
LRLTLHVRITSRLIKQEARRQAFPGKPGHGPPTACKHTVSGSISLPSQGCFSPFPHGTGSLSVAREYLALESGLPSFPPDYTCPVVLRIPLRVRSTVDYGVLTLYDSAFQQIRLVVELITLLMRSYNPQSASTWVWAVPISLAATFGISVIYFPPGTEMVHFPGLAHTNLFYSVGCNGSSSRRVSPFGDPRIKACLRLPEAYRSLPRPSSPSGAKASTVRS